MSLEFSPKLAIPIVGALMLGIGAPCAAQSAAQPAVGALLVTCDGPCRVRVDGQDLGEAPAVAQGLLPGQHLVEAVGPDGATFRDVAEVTAGRSTAFQVELPAAAGGASTPSAPETSAGPVDLRSDRGGPAGLRAVVSNASAAPTAEVRPTEERPMPQPTGPLPQPTAHERGGLTPPPDRWNGGYRTFPGLGITFIVLGGLMVSGSSISLLYGSSLHQSHPDREPFTILGAVGTVGGIAVAVGGILGLLFMKGAGPSDESGVVYFAGVEPLLNVSDEGAVMGARVRW